MEAAASVIQSLVSAAAFRPSSTSAAVRSNLLTANSPNFLALRTKSHSVKHRFSSSCRRSRRSFIVKATSASSSSSSGDSGATAPIAPLQLESPIGQFLSQMMISHPHLVPTAIDQQLEQLQTDRDAEQHKKDEAAAAASGGTDLVLYKRIAEVKANERKKALEEILYALVVQKFMEADVSLVPSIAPVAASSSDPSGGRVDAWPSQDDEKLVRLHSPEAYEMIQNHLSLILGNRLDDSTSLAQISKLRVGQVYAASVMYGYFLKRVDQRFQLEKTMKILPGSVGGDDESGVERAVGKDKKPDASHPEVSSSWSGGGMGSGAAGVFGNMIKPSRLRTYVMSVDGETLQNYATIRSREAVSIIEKHTEALFGRPDIVITPQGTVDDSNDKHIKISFGGLKRLVLEAVTFGSFLWDVESYVDSRYHFVTN